MKTAARANLALWLLIAGLVSPARAELPRGRGVLLPLQDRVGEALVAQVIESRLRQELGTRVGLAETETLRAVLRSLRVRDASNESPDRLAVLAERLDADWFFLATLHEARAGRKLQREDGAELRSQRIEDAGDTPQVVLSARVLRSDSAELWWAGFKAASGRDGERALGLGEVETLEELMQSAVAELVSKAVEPRKARGRPRLRSRYDGYLRSPIEPSPSQRVAVIPMDSVARLGPSASAEVATAALFAALDESGFKALLPGLVQAIRQDNGQIQYGAASRSEWEALAREGGARWVATGTVEVYRRGQGRTPDPRVAFSIRLLDAVDGRIDWSNGLDLSGRDTASIFDRGRIYSTGDLTYEMMRSLFGKLPAGSGAGETNGRN